MQRDAMTMTMKIMMVAVVSRTYGGLGVGVGDQTVLSIVGLQVEGQITRKDARLEFDASGSRERVTASDVSTSPIRRSARTTFFSSFPLPQSCLPVAQCSAAPLGLTILVPLVLATLAAGQAIYRRSCESPSTPPCSASDVQGSYARHRKSLSSSPVKASLRGLG